MPPTVWFDEDVSSGDEADIALNVPTSPVPVSHDSDVSSVDSDEDVGEYDPLDGPAGRQFLQFLYSQPDERVRGVRDQIITGTTSDEWQFGPHHRRPSRSSRDSGVDPLSSSLLRYMDGAYPSLSSKEKHRQDRAIEKLQQVWCGVVWCGVVCVCVGGV